MLVPGAEIVGVVWEWGADGHDKWGCADLPESLPNVMSGLGGVWHTILVSVNDLTTQS